MPRHAPCAACGWPLQIGRTSRPVGEAMHRECRRASHPHGSDARWRSGCRCAECRAWKAADFRSYRRQRREQGRPIPKRSWLAVAVRRMVYERDGWICQLCGDAVEREAHWNADLAPSIDHVVPASLGGTDEPENLRTAHRWCNCVRGADLLNAAEFRSLS